MACCCLLLAVCCLLFVVGGLSLAVVAGLSPVVCWLVVCCLLAAGCCLLPVVADLLLGLRGYAAFKLGPGFLFFVFVGKGRFKILNAYQVPAQDPGLCAGGEVGHETFFGGGEGFDQGKAGGLV